MPALGQGKQEQDQDGAFTSRRYLMAFGAHADT